MSNQSVNRPSLIGGEPDLSWHTCPNGPWRTLFGRTLEGVERLVQADMDPALAAEIANQHNQDLAALSVWWRRQHEAELAFYRSQRDKIA